MTKIWRLAAVMLALLVLPKLAAAQEWIEFSSKQDRFEVNFPGQPTVRDFTYTSWLEAKLPARVYTVSRGAERYSVTVIDYTAAQRVHAEMAAKQNCSPGTPPNQCTAAIAGSDSAAQGVGAWKYDVLGAEDHATEEILKRDAKVTYFAWATIDRITGRQIHLNNPDGSRTLVEMHMLENRLFIFEATVPKGAPEPGLFQQSPRLLDGDGKPVRYPDNYINMYGIPENSPARQPQPPRAGRGGGGGGGQAAPAGQGAPTP